MNDRRDFLKATALAPFAATDAEAGGELVPAGSSASSPSDSGKSDKLPPIREEPYRDYHLLGKPDPEANLLGTDRPRDWHTTKRMLVKSLGEVAQAEDPIHAWLKTFEDSFDAQTSVIVLNAVAGVAGPAGTGQFRYEPQLYDASLRSAAALLDRCLQYRLAMNSYEQAGVSGGLAYLSFLRLRPLQRNFIVQANMAELASIERNTETLAAENIHAVKGLVRLFEKYQLQAREIEAEGAAQQSGVTEAKDNFLTHLLEKQFHLQIDAQLALFTKLLTPGSASNYAERYIRTLALLAEDLTDAYRKLCSASIGVQQVLALQKIIVGSQAPIGVEIPRWSSADQLNQWIAQLLPAQGADQRSPNVLDALVLWTRAVMRELDIRAQTEAEFTLSIPLSQPWGSQKVPLVPQADLAKAFQGNSPTGKVGFSLDSSDIPTTSPLKSVRVTGIGVTFERSADDASPVQFTTGFPHTPSNPVVAVEQTPSPNQEPTNAQIAATQAFEVAKLARLNVTVATPAQSIPGGGNYNRPAVFLANVRIQGGSGGDQEAVLSYDPACRGLSPFGGWTLSIDPNVVTYFQSAGAVADSWITGLMFHLRLRASMT